MEFYPGDRVMIRYPINDQCDGVVLDFHHDSDRGDLYLVQHSSGVPQRRSYQEENLELMDES